MAASRPRAARVAAGSVRSARHLAAAIAAAGHCHPRRRRHRRCHGRCHRCCHRCHRCCRRHRRSTSRQWRVAPSPWPPRPLGRCGGPSAAAPWTGGSGGQARCWRIESGRPGASSVAGRAVGAPFPPPLPPALAAHRDGSVAEAVMAARATYTPAGWRRASASRLGCGRAMCRRRCRRVGRAGRRACQRAYTQGTPGAPRRLTIPLRTRGRARRSGGSQRDQGSRSSHAAGVGNRRVPFAGRRCSACSYGPRRPCRRSGTACGARRTGRVRCIPARPSQRCGRRG
jgi:hypothetical protein